MPISWNEIRHNAVAFAKEWAGESSEHAERQSFWNDFFAVFGVKRRTVASFEKPVKKLSGHWGHIDLFWPGTLLVEHKSLGKPLDKAEDEDDPDHQRNCRRYCCARSAPRPDHGPGAYVEAIGAAAGGAPARAWAGARRPRGR